MKKVLVINKKSKTLIFLTGNQGNLLSYQLHIILFSEVITIISSRVFHLLFFSLF